MLRTTFFFSAFVFLIAAPAALVACSHDGDDSTSATESNATASPHGSEGTTCWVTRDCLDGLVCKPRPSGPPPGAVGLPLPSSSASSGPPPGAVGIPISPNTCQQPSAGEEGSRCMSTADCTKGLACSFESGSASSSTGGMPPGAVGMPVPSSSAHAFPPGAVGMPVPHYGKCTAATSSSSSSSTGGMPPGAVGIPIRP